MLVNLKKIEFSRIITFLAQFVKYEFVCWSIGGIAADFSQKTIILNDKKYNNIFVLALFSAY